MTFLEIWFHVNLIAGVVLFGTVEPWSRCLLELSWYVLTLTALFRGVIAIEAFPPLTAGLAGVAALAAWQARTGHTASPWASATAARLWAMYACASWCAAGLIATRRLLRRMILVVFGLGIFVAVEGMFQHGRFRHLIYGFRPSVMSFGPFYNRNHAAGFLAVAAVLGGGLLVAQFPRLTARRRTPGRQADLIADQTVLAVLIGLVLAAMMATTSRGGAQACLAGGGLMLYLGAVRFASVATRRWIHAGLIAAVIAYGAVLVAWPGLAGWRKSQAAFDVSTQARFDIWQLSVAMAAQRPATGWGMGAFRYAFAPWQAVSPLLSTGEVQHAHGDWLQFLAEGGGVGFGLIVGALLVQLRRQFGQWRRDQDLEVWGLTGGALAAVLTLIAHGFVDFDLQIPGLMAVFVVVASAFYPLRAVLPAVPPVRRLLTVALVAAIGWCGAGGFRAGLAWGESFISFDQDAGGRVGLLSRALNLDPGNPEIRRNLGVAYLWLGDEYPSASIIYAMKARETAEAGLAQSPDLAGLLEIQGVALLRLNRIQDGQAALARAKTLQPWVK